MPLQSTPQLLETRSGHRRKGEETISIQKPSYSKSVTGEEQELPVLNKVNPKTFLGYTRAHFVNDVTRHVESTVFIHDFKTIQ